MKFNFLLIVIFILITSCSPEDSKIETGYSPGIKTVTPISSLSLVSPNNSYGTSKDIELSIKGVLNGDSLFFYKDSECKNLISTQKYSGSNIILRIEQEGDYIISVIRESNGIKSSCKGSIFYSLDTVNPVLTIDNIQFTYINSNNQNQYKIEGTCSKENREIFVSIENESNFTQTQSICLNGRFDTELDISSIEDSSLNIKVFQSSLSGLYGESSISQIVKETTMPLLSFNSEDIVSTINVISYLVEGSCSENNQSIKIEMSNIILKETTCQSNVFSETLDLSSVSQGQNTLNINHSDEFGNEININKIIVKDTVAPSITGLFNENEILTSKTWNWSCSESTCFYKFVIDQNPNTLATGSNWKIDTSASISNATGTFYLHIKTKDDLDNVSETFHYSVQLDPNGPISPTITLTNPSTNYSTDDSFSFNISNLIIGQTLSIFNDKTCTDLNITKENISTTDVFSKHNLNDGVFDYSFRVKNNSNQLSDCITESYTMDTVNPVDNISVLMKSPLNNSISKDNSPHFFGDISSENGSTIYIYSDNTCQDKKGYSSIIQGSFLVDNVFLPLDGTATGINNFYAKIIDKAGNESNCNDLNLKYTLEKTGLANLLKIALVGNNSPTNIISLEDNNEIKLNDTIISANASKAQIIYSNTNQGDILECSKACFPITQGYGTAPWASEAYSGKLFTSYLLRQGEFKAKIHVAALGGNSFVEVKQSGNIVDSFLIPKNTTHEFSVSLENNKTFIVEGTKNIAVFVNTRTSNSASYDSDSRVLTPASKEIIGFSGHITSTEINTTINTYRTSGENFLNEVISTIDDYFFEGRMRQTDIDNWGVIAKADKPISMTQTADNNGRNATPSLPTSMLATNYGLPRNANYVAFLSKLTGNVSVLNPNGSLNRTLSLNNSSSNINSPFIASYKVSSGVIPKGSTLVCSVPCMAIYDDVDTGADSDETLMMGFTP